MNKTVLPLTKALRGIKDGLIHRQGIKSRAILEDKMVGLGLIAAGALGLIVPTLFVTTPGVPAWMAVLEMVVGGLIVANSLLLKRR